MAPSLQPSVVPILFGKLDTKTAPRLAQQGTLVECINAQMTQTGRLQKRPGTTALTKPSGITNAQKIASFNGELAVQTQDSIWSYAASTQTWTKRGSWSRVQPRVDNIVSDVGNQINVDVAIGAGLACFVWTDLRNASAATPTVAYYYAIQDAMTGSTVVAPTKFVSNTGAGITTPGVSKVVFIDGVFIIVTHRSGGLFEARSVAAATPGTISGATALPATNGADAAHGAWDILAVPQLDAVLVAYGVNVSNFLGLVSLNPNTMAVTAALTFAGIVTATSATMCWMTDDFSDSRVYLTVHSTNNVSVNTFQASGSGEFILILTEFLWGSAGTESQVVGWIDRSTTPITKYVLCHQAGASSKTVNDFITKITSTGGGNVATLIRSVGLASRAWRSGGNTYVVMAYEGFQSTSITNIQQSYFVAKVDGDIVQAGVGNITILAKFLGTLGAGMRAAVSSVGSVVAVPGTTKWLTAQSRKTQVATTAAGGTVLIKSAVRVTFDLADPSLSAPHALGQGLYVPGGFLRHYDQANSFELGFHVYPEPVTLASGSAVSGMAGGVYSYVAVYAAYDRFGNLHRSAPSTAATITLAANTAANVTVGAYRVTDGGSGGPTRPGVFVEIYRANPGDTNFYKISSIDPTQGPLANDPSQDTVNTYTGDTFSDAALLTQEPLYTDGGVFVNDAPPPARLVQQHRDRIWLAAVDVPNTLWPSKPILPGQGLSFSANFAISLDPNDGEVTALASMDDKLIVFTANAIYYITGDGPNVVGQGAFAAPVRLPSNVGTSSPTSVVLCDDGVRFQSSNSGGLYRLGRDLSVTYVGAEVEAFNSTAITGAVVIPQLNQTRFATAAGSTLVHDDYHQQWYQWKYQAAAHACLHQGVFTYVTAAGQVYQEAQGVYGDAGAPIAMRVTLAWLQPFAPGGWGRLWALHLIGDYRDAHKVRVGLRYDHQDAVLWEELQIDAAAACAAPAFGASSPYGTGNYGGAVAGDYRFEVRPRQQRGSAFQIVFQEVISDGSNNAGMDLSAIVMLIGAQPGALAKLPASRQMVTQ